MRALRSALLASIFVCGCSCGPFLLLPGGKLDGPVKPAPASFAFAADAGTIQLETRPADPYSVNVEGAVVGEGLYVSAGDSKSRWVENIEADPLVRARILGNVYELRARRVVDKAELQRFAAVWTSLGSWARDPMQFPEVWVYQLGPR
jgi:F420H(2)-dependent quinone reductase